MILFLASLFFHIIELFFFTLATSHDCVCYGCPCEIRDVEERFVTSISRVGMGERKARMDSSVHLDSPEISDN